MREFVISKDVLRQALESLGDVDAYAILLCEHPDSGELLDRRLVLSTRRLLLSPISKEAKPKLQFQGSGTAKTAKVSRSFKRTTPVLNISEVPIALRMTENHPEHYPPSGRRCAAACSAPYIRNAKGRPNAYSRQQLLTELNKPDFGSLGLCHCRNQVAPNSTLCSIHEQTLQTLGELNWEGYVKFLREKYGLHADAGSVTLSMTR
jgi:hypothetical protein